MLAESPSHPPMPGEPAEERDGRVAVQHTDDKTQIDFAVGVSLVLAESTLSALSNVYFEKVVKTTSTTIWERNVQLAAYSLLIYIPYAEWESPGHVTKGWSAVTCMTAMLGAGVGITVGLSLKYLDSILKNLAVASGLLVISTLDHYLFGAALPFAAVMALMTAVLAILIYTSPSS